MEVADKKKEVTAPDLEAIVSDEMRIAHEAIKLQAVNINTAFPNGMPTASVRLTNADGQELSESAIGTGPVDATYKAINKVVGVPNKLTEYTVQSVTEGIDAVANVTIRVESQNESFIGRGADTDILIASAQAYVRVVDMGVGRPTANIARGPAMSREQAIQCLEQGIAIANEEIARGATLLATGDMGIGNTTASSAVVAALTRHPVRQVTGRGTGVSDEQFDHKVAVIERALDENHPKPDDAIDVLAKVGGFEIAAITGL